MKASGVASFGWRLSYVLFNMYRSGHLGSGGTS
jgi:hypothetical protein